MRAHCLFCPRFHLMDYLKHFSYCWFVVSTSQISFSTVCYPLIVLGPVWFELCHNSVFPRIFFKSWIYISLSSLEFWLVWSIYVRKSTTNSSSESSGFSSEQFNVQANAQANAFLPYNTLNRNSLNANHSFH